VEVQLAAARRSPAPPPSRAYAILASLARIAVDWPTLRHAAGMRLQGLRALDAIQLASAQLLGEGLDVFIAYDKRLPAAARACLRPDD